MERIKENLSSVSSLKPFELIFYGSRQRGDGTLISDFNFFLLADPSDQLKSNFIREINQALEPLQSQGPVNLVSGDWDSFRLRMKCFDPGAVHICEIGEPYFGSEYFPIIKEEWDKIKVESVDVLNAGKYLRKRYRFFKGIVPRNTKEDVLRMERLLAIYLQTWMFRHIDDVSVAEIVNSDIPSRIGQMFRGLYSKEAKGNVIELTDLYDEIVKLKAELKNPDSPFSAERFQQIKETLRFEEKEIRILKLNY
ncbi:hypothetical protein LEP1GSC047_0299 [Leptospira inadai serovar Lyme str. 10]|uniref:Nucleotidyltransferase domain protein n=2 Tax=Leptospira inadai serovar Lyme TaxID=293084 RepID=V6H9S8_9LEPT|nr:hypothetical protein [Leptospira inadai]EQA35797.1 hypothetical protein LEP1GSC047_0299 [Leptospira inadai serovar Lyme str. 10]PNV76799.1 hypothetical protein BES34_000470 [Leptospira inadai serovar Lyme]